MSKKIDINKLLSTGSAKQRAVLLFYHYNLKEGIDKGINLNNHILPLTDKEATELFNSFKDNKEIKVYNDYRALNIQVIQAMKWLLQLIKSFETEYWKYNALYLQNKYVVTGGEKFIKEKYTSTLEDMLIYHYSTALEYYSALKIYIKESRYRDKYVIGSNFEDFKTLLKEKNIKMSILSNMPESWGRYLCSKFNLDKDFNPILFSSVVGISKPNRGIFIELFKETGINPEKMLFIDDQLKNLKTASELGMKTMLFSQKSIKEESFSPDYIISSFKTVSG